MAKRKQSDPPAAPAPSAVESEGVAVVVQPGHTLQVARERHGPGSICTVDPADVPRLIALGVVRRAGE